MKRDLAGLHRQVCFGESQGRIIWQPRIGCWYTDKQFAGEQFPTPFTGMNLYEIYRELGCSARLYEFNSCFKRVEDPTPQVEHKQLNETDTQITISTPVGDQTLVIRKTMSSPHPITLKREVETEQEMKVAIWREEHTRWQWDQNQYDALLASICDLGAPTMFMPRMNVQSLYVEKMGVSAAIYALYDWKDTVEAFFRAVDESHIRLIEVINASPIEIINFGENIHSGTLSPDLFLKYHLPACQMRCELLHRAGKFVTSHWDGDTKPLLPYAKETELDAIEAITPKPQGDVTLEEIKEALGDDIFLMDGIPAIYFDKTFTEETLVQCTQRLIELFAPKLILGISDEISSTGDLERVRLVGQIVDDYNAQFE